MYKRVGKMFTVLLCCFLYTAVMAISATAPVHAAEATETPDENEADMDNAYVFFKPDKTAEVPVIMYHLITKNRSLVGRYGITPEDLESDLKYLHDNGYETVVMADLIAFVNRGKPLPKKPVVLTFDDGNFSDYLYLYPLLQKYKQQAVLSILGKQADEYTVSSEKNPTAKYPNLTWPQIKEMKDKGCVEIQSHGYNMHGSIGSAKRRNESVDAYKERFGNDLRKLQERCKDELRFTPTTFAYPLGLISESSGDVLNELGFSASLSCCEGMNLLKTGEPECLFRIKRNIRPNGRSIESVLERMKAKK